MKLEILKFIGLQPFQYTNRISLWRQAYHLFPYTIYTAKHIETIYGRHHGCPEGEL